MNIEDSIKKFEADILQKLKNDKSQNYSLGICYTIGMINKHFKNKTDCWFYGTDTYCCKKCEYICNRYQKKEEIKDENNTI